MKKIFYALCGFVLSASLCSCGLLFGDSEGTFTLENRTSSDITITEIDSPIEYSVNGQPFELPATVAAGGSLNLQMTKWGEGVSLYFTCGGKNYVLNEYTEHSNKLRYVIEEQNGLAVAQNSQAVRERK